MADWVCPWGICNHEKAQECRANTRRGKHGIEGCGGRFPPGTTPEQAKEIVRPPRGVQGNPCTFPDCKAGACCANPSNARGVMGTQGGKP